MIGRPPRPLSAVQVERPALPTIAAFAVDMLGHPSVDANVPPVRSKEDVSISARAPGDPRVPYDARCAAANPFLIASTKAITFGDKCRALE